jgi:hypothetical protein
MEDASAARIVNGQFAFHFVSRDETNQVPHEPSRSPAEYTARDVAKLDVDRVHISAGLAHHYALDD